MRVETQVDTDILVQSDSMNMAGAIDHARIAFHYEDYPLAIAQATDAYSNALETPLSSYKMKPYG